MWIAHKKKNTCGWWEIFLLQKVDGDAEDKTKDQTEIKFEDLIDSDVNVKCDLCKAEGHHDNLGPAQLLEAKWKAGQVPFLQLVEKK